MAQRATWVSALVLAMLPAPSVAQSAEETIKVQDSLKTGARVRSEPGTALDPTKAGYYRVTVNLGAYPKDAFCWTSKKERDKFVKSVDAVWSYAVKRKKDWGAGVNLVFDGRKPNYESSNFASNLWVKLFAVEIDGSDPDECQFKMGDFSTYESPLVPIDAAPIPNITYVQFLTWYNDKSDRGRIESIVKGGSALLAFAGVPIGAFQKIESSAVDEIQKKVEKKRTSDYRTELSPFSVDKIETRGYLGLREPAAAPTTEDARVTVKLVPIASMFAGNAESFDKVNLGSSTPNQLLKLPVQKSKDDPTKIYLEMAVGEKTTLLTEMRAAKENATASDRCETLELELMNKMNFSSTDAAILLYAAGQERVGSGLTQHIRDIKCINDREAKLARVKISLPSKIVIADPVPISKTDMRDRMNTFAQFRAVEADAIPQSNWSIFAFPLIVADPSNALGLPNQQAIYTAENRAGLKALLDAQTKSAGCWAYFDSNDFELALGLGGPDAKKNIRKSAALLRLANDDVIVVQFRYNGDPTGQKIDGLGLTRSDAASKELMLKNPDCNVGISGKEWMQKFLRP